MGSGITPRERRKTWKNTDVLCACIFRTQMLGAERMARSPELPLMIYHMIGFALIAVLVRRMLTLCNIGLDSPKRATWCSPGDLTVGGPNCRVEGKNPVHQLNVGDCRLLQGYFGTILKATSFPMCCACPRVVLNSGMI